jgi:hypothetical protein
MRIFVQIVCWNDCSTQTTAPCPVLQALPVLTFAVA